MKTAVAASLSTTACAAQAHAMGSTEQTVLALCITALCVLCFGAGVLLGVKASKCRKDNP